MTPMAGTAVTSERSDCACAGPPVLRSTVRSGDISVEIGFIATRATSGSPVVLPPSAPPARVVARLRPGGLPARRAPRRVGGPAQPGEDVVVPLGAVAARRLEAEAQLHAFHRRDGHEGL